MGVGVDPGRDRVPAGDARAGFETWLVNAKDVKHLPGRPKTDKLDAVWLCKVAERQMIRPSFVPPPQIRRLRDVTRYRIDLVGVRTAEKQRVEKLLEDACIKLSVVASDIFGKSGRDMLNALASGERNPKVLAQMARTSMRRKISVLEEAFTGHFTEHHSFLLTKMLARVDALDADIAELDTKIEVTRHLNQSTQNTWMVSRRRSYICNHSLPHRPGQKPFELRIRVFLRYRIAQPRLRHLIQ